MKGSTGGERESSSRSQVTGSEGFWGKDGAGFRIRVGFLFKLRVSWGWGLVLRVVMGSNESMTHNTCRHRHGKATLMVKRWKASDQACVKAMPASKTNWRSHRAHDCNTSETCLCSPSWL